MIPLFRLYLPRVPVLIMVCLMIIGCSASSEWDRQWDEIEEAIQDGRIQEAKTRLSNLLPAVKQDGPKNQRYAQVIFRLGGIAQLEGNDLQAEAYFWEALPLWAQSVGPEHPRMAETLLAIGSLYEKKGKSDIALPLVKRAVAIQEKAWGESDIRVLPSLEIYHALLQTQNRENERQEIQTRITRLRRAD